MRLLARTLLFMVILLFLLDPHSGAVLARGKEELIRESLVSEGIQRTYYVHAPRSYDPARGNSCLMLFHEMGSDPREICKMTGMEELSDKYGFLLVCPQAVKEAWNDGRGHDRHFQFNDVAFVDSLMKALQRKWNVDERTVFAVGFGNGGFFAQFLAMRLPGKLAGIGSVAASMPALLFSTQHVKDPVSMIYVLGTEDPVVPWGGGPIGDGTVSLAVSASQAVEYWVKVNHCQGNFIEQEIPDADQTDKTTARLCSYGGGVNGSEVVIVGVEGGGHGWPRASSTARKSLGAVSRDFDAGDLMCKFFLRHGLSSPR